MNYGIIGYTLGWVLNFEAICMLLPLGCAAVYNDTSSITVFIASIVICLVIGIMLVCLCPKNKAMYTREGFVTVALSWIVISLFGALPFLISGYISNPIDAVFETVSGFTTTGASILKDVEALPKALLFWRSFTHWIGGMGVLVLIVAVLPLFGVSNFNLIKAESPGPAVSKLVPKVKTTAKILYMIYFGMTVLEIILLLLGNMNLFDALTISFGTAGTGGFGVRNSSAADYSPYLQVVITVFMIMFGVDFSLYYLLLRKKIVSVFKSSELKTYLAIITVSIIVISINCMHLFPDFWVSLRHSAFQVGSIITTTGYSTTDFDKWPELSKTILIALMFIGACAGSTGGGIKVSRLIIVFKTILKEIRIVSHPRTTHLITMSGKPVKHETIRAVNVFMAAYVIIFALSVILISKDNFNFATNFTAVAATINNIGPGLAGVGPTSNFSGYSDFSTVVLTFDMLIGRLEIFPILMLVFPNTWRK